MKDEQLEDLKHKNKMLELEFDRDTKIILLEKEYELQRRLFFLQQQGQGTREGYRGSYPAVEYEHQLPEAPYPSELKKPEDLSSKKYGRPKI